MLVNTKILKNKLYFPQSKYQVNNKNNYFIIEN